MDTDVDAGADGDGDGDGVMEDLESFRQRARAFARANLAPFAAHASVGALRNDRNDEEELSAVAREREIQGMLFGAGLAGICFPRAYGGQGLTPAHQAVLNEELVGYEFPTRLQAPTLAPCAAVLLDFGTEEQKRRHIPAILKGEEIWMQFLSEPSGGSDVAGALTSAVRDGDEWVLNGSKIWTTGAWWSDWGLCLARTNWDVPKHRGLTVFMLPIRQQGLEIHRIEMLNGSKEFCQEFLSDVRVPDSDRIGDVDDGWTVGTRWMFHERMLTNSPLVTVPTGFTNGGVGASVMDVVARACRPPRRSARPRPDRPGAGPRPRRSRAQAAHRRGDRVGGPARPVGGDRPPVHRSRLGPHPDHRLRDLGPGRRGMDRGGGGAGLQRQRLPHAAGVVHRRRHDRDGPQRDQRARARDAAGAIDGPRRAVPRRATGRRLLPGLTRVGLPGEPVSRRARPATSSRRTGRTRRRRSAVRCRCPCSRRTAGRGCRSCPR